MAEGKAGKATVFVSIEDGIPAEMMGLEPTTWPTYGGTQRIPFSGQSDCSKAGKSAALWESPSGDEFFIGVDLA